MGSKFDECLTSHTDLVGKVNGCQEFMEKRDYISKNLYCGACHCNPNFHRKIEPEPAIKYRTEVVYTKFHKIHDFQFRNMVDGCQEFIPSGRQGTAAEVFCAACGGHKSFYQNEVSVEDTSFK